MTPAELIAAFEALAEAPDGVEQLRGLILQLAIRGRLVSQNPEDEPASQLLDRIAAERKREVEAGSVRHSAQRPPGTAENVVEDIPAQWAAIPFGSVFLDILTGPFGTSLKKSDYTQGGTPVINPQNLRAGRIVPTDETCVGVNALRRLAGFCVRARDVVVARRGEMGRCSVVTPLEEGWLCGTGSLVLRPPSCLDARFVTLYLSCPSTVARLSSDSVGATMKNLNQRIMVNLPFALPPLAEQRRIVARVDELMGLLDRLQAARTKRESTRAAARDSVLAALREADSPEAVDAAWTRFAQRMDDLLCDPADIAPVRQAVLQLAVRGRLVRQDPNDEPASVLLNRIAAQRESSVKAGKIRKEAPLPAVEGGDRRDVPSGWQAVRFGSVIDLISGQHLSPDEYSLEPGDLPYLTGPADFGLRFPTASRWTKERRAIALIGDILVTVKGAGIGKTNVLDSPEAAISRQLMAVRPMLIDARFCDLLLKSAAAVLAQQQTGIAIPGIGRDEILHMVVLVPPLSEQQRIVACVDELVSLLDRLERRLAAAREVHAAFAGAAVHHVVA
jgi:type I restriction enzyme S subunit